MSATFDIADSTPIKGFENYRINANAQILNTKTGKLLTPSPSSKGYLYVTLFKKNRQHKFGLQNLVGKYYVPGRTRTKNQIGWKNQDRSDCRAINLYWTTHQERCQTGQTGKKDNQNVGEKNPKSKLTVKDVLEIRRVWEKEKREVTQKQLALKYNVKPSTIQRVVNYESWQTLQKA